jgi:hypothetical protein
MMPSSAGSWAALGGGGAGDSFGVRPAWAELVRSRISRQTPKVLCIAFPFVITGANQRRRRILLKDGGFVAADKNLSPQGRACLT